jgi:hypothetical protein
MVPELIHFERPPSIGIRGQIRDLFSRIIPHASFPPALAGGILISTGVPGALAIGGTDVD